jgi:hypothetical protein
MSTERVARADALDDALERDLAGADHPRTGAVGQRLRVGEQIDGERGRRRQPATGPTAPPARGAHGRHRGLGTTGHEQRRIRVQRGRHQRKRAGYGRIDSPTNGNTRPSSSSSSQFDEPSATANARPPSTASFDEPKRAPT